MRFALAVLILLLLMPIVAVTGAAVQATCRQKCVNDENACLKRTGNKRQCGDKVKICAEKCNKRGESSCDQRRADSDANLQRGAGNLSGARSGIFMLVAMASLRQPL